MSLLDLIDFCASLLASGFTRNDVDLELNRMGIDLAVIEEIQHTLNDDGSQRRAV